VGKLDWQLDEDRALRDAASVVLKEDLALLRDKLSPNELANRLGHRAEESGGEVVEKASRFIHENKGGVLAGVAAAGGLAALFLFPNPVRSAIARRMPIRGKSQEPERSQSRFPEEATDIEREGKS